MLWQAERWQALAKGPLGSVSGLGCSSPGWCCCGIILGPFFSIKTLFSNFCTVFTELSWEFYCGENPWPGSKLLVDFFLASNFHKIQEHAGTWAPLASSRLEKALGSFSQFYPLFTLRMCGQIPSCLSTFRGIKGLIQVISDAIWDHKFS